MKSDISMKARCCRCGALVAETDKDFEGRVFCRKCGIMLYVKIIDRLIAVQQLTRR